MFSNKILCEGTYFFLLLTAESAEIAEIIFKNELHEFHECLFYFIPRPHLLGILFAIKPYFILFSYIYERTGAASRLK